MHPISHAFMPPGGPERSKQHKGAVGEAEAWKTESLNSEHTAPRCLQGLDLCKADQSPSQEGPQSLGNLATMHSSMIRNPLLGSRLRGHWKKCVGKGNVASLGLESPLPRSFLLAGAACVGWAALLEKKKTILKEHYACSRYSKWVGKGKPALLKRMWT